MLGPKTLARTWVYARAHLLSPFYAPTMPHSARCEGGESFGVEYPDCKYVVARGDCTDGQHSSGADIGRVSTRESRGTGSPTGRDWHGVYSAAPSRSKRERKSENTCGGYDARHHKWYALNDRMLSVLIN